MQKGNQKMNKRRITLLILASLLALLFITYLYFFRYAPCSCMAYSEGIRKINKVIEELTSIQASDESDSSKTIKLLDLKQGFENQSNLPTCLEYSKSTVALGLLLEIQRMDPKARLSEDDLKLLDQFHKSVMGSTLSKGVEPERLSNLILEKVVLEVKRAGLSERGLIFCCLPDPWHDDQ
jgi:hypothetical protein